MKAHPRSRGENLFEGGELAACSGSSPLTRGKQSRMAGECSWMRLIPAHAGKTTTRLSSRSPRKAHPRSRGENLVGDNPYCVDRGSSPLTRGKRSTTRASDLEERLIPAHAGKTESLVRVIDETPAHPRSRGENSDSFFAAVIAMGSSPLTRGKRGARAHEAARARLIPAHAGKTGRPGPRRRGGPAHPRSRGENDLVTRFFQGRPGSSPLTRGKRRT